MDPQRSILGTGWSFPPTFSREEDSVVMVSDDTDIRQSLHVLFSTSWGERIMVPTYGCSLIDLVFQGMTTTLETEIAGAVRVAVLNWEPRIDVDAVFVQSNAGTDGLIEITVEYTIRRTNTRSNQVYPFYLLEGTLVPAGL